TKTGMLAGTPAYLAPELARGSDPAPPSDVFSLGATIYAMTEGEPPFGKSTNDLGLLYKVARGETRPPMRSGPLTPLLLRMLANEPSQRPNATQAAAELKAIAEGQVVPATALIPPRPMTPPSGTAVMPSGPGTQGPRTVPPLGPRTRPPEPVYDDYDDYEPEPAPKKSRALAIAASLLAVLLIAGVAYAIIQSQGKKDNSTAGPSTSASKTPSQTQPPPSATKDSPTKTSEKPPSETYPSKPTSEAPKSKFTKAQVADFVQQYFAKLPQNAAESIEDWDPETAPTENAEKSYWGDYTKVVLKGNPLVTASDDGTFQVTQAADMTAAETNKTSREEFTLKISGKGDKLLILALKRP
ncbi:MAG: eukaryotic-like serine/threonine-protein kinase, partial [Pseudonocardiales bacterium]|nr:eukaryotic-like serine/threonine-protein kinase [Pseudonocardiales bacterium]